MDHRYIEYERLLFTQIDKSEYEFHPFDEQDAEYWCHQYSNWIRSADIHSSSRHTLTKGSTYRTLMGKYIHFDQILDEILIAVGKVSAIWNWYEKQGLKHPEIFSLLPFDYEWTSMVEGYEIRIEKWYLAKLEKVKNKFSRFENIDQEMDNSELFDRKDWSIIYRLAEDMRFRKEQGEFETYEAAYSYAEKYNTVKGKPVTIHQLKNNWYKTKSSTTFLDD